MARPKSEISNRPLGTKEVRTKFRNALKSAISANQELSTELDNLLGTIPAHELMQLPRLNQFKSLGLNASNTIQFGNAVLDRTDVKA